MAVNLSNVVGGVGAGLGSLVGLFLPNAAQTATTNTASELGSFASGAAGDANTLSSESQGALGPVLNYYKGLLSGSPGALSAATAPDVGRVIDQYDTARKAATTFAPRSGGTAAAGLASRSAEARDIARTVTGARSHAASTLGQLGLGTASAAAAQEGIAGNDLSSVLQTYLQQSENTQQAASGFGSAVGSILGLIATA